MTHAALNDVESPLCLLTSPSTSKKAIAFSVLLCKAAIVLINCVKCLRCLFRPPIIDARLHTGGMLCTALEHRPG